MRRLKKIMTKNPWENIDGKGVDSQRANLESKFNFFWSLGPKREYQFRINHINLKDWPQKKININGVDVKQFSITNGYSIVLVLTDKTNSDIFYNLCSDIIESTKKLENERVMLTIVHNKLLRWQSFFKKNNIHLLSLSEQKGLIGELIFLHKYLMSKYSHKDSLTFWQGPLGGRQDFSIGNICVEVKTKSGTASPLIQISSIDQLDFVSDKCYLYVISINTADAKTNGSFSLNSLVKMIRNEFVDSDNLDIYFNLLLKIGYTELEEYSENNYVVLNESFFEIAEDFPRLVASDVPSGIVSVNYQIDINKISKFLVSETSIPELN